MADIMKELKLKDNVVLAIYFLVVLMAVGFLAGMVGFGSFLFSFPTENFIGLLITLTIAGVIKSLAESKLGFNVGTKGKDWGARLKRGLFTSIYLTVGLWVVGFLAGFVGFTQFLLDLQVAANFVSIAITLVIAAVLVELIQEKVKI